MINSLHYVIITVLIGTHISMYNALLLSTAYYVKLLLSIPTITNHPYLSAYNVISLSITYLASLALSIPYLSLSVSITHSSEHNTYYKQRVT